MTATAQKITTDQAPANTDDRPTPAAAHTGEHPLLEMPFSAFVGADAVAGKALSLTHAVVEGTLDPALVGTKAPLTVRVDFAGFTLVMFMDVWVELGEDGRFQLRFDDPTGDHLPSLRYLLNSYIAGDVVSLGGVMNYSGPLVAKAKGKATAPGRLFRIKEAIRRVAVGGLSVALLLVAAQLVHDRVVFSYEARPVTLTQPGQTLKATAAGQLSYVDPDAREGDVLFAILANSGDYYSVKMPCDCAVQPLRDFVQGATVMPGAPLARLSNGQSGLVSATEISAEGAAKLLSGEQAELIFPDGSVIPVDPTILTDQDLGEKTVAIEMAIAADAAIEPGAVARLRFRRVLLGGSFGRALAGVGETLGLSAAEASQ